MKLKILIVGLLTSFCSLSQMDTIYANNNKIACLIQEVTNESVIFIYPEESIKNSIYKNSIQKVVFKSGRVQMFSESVGLKSVEYVGDYEKVALSVIESEVQGLFKIGEVSVKWKGFLFADQEKVKRKAYEKLKIQAAMQGANLVYLANHRSDGHQSILMTAETSLTGVAYTNVLPKQDDFERKLNNKKDLIAHTETKLESSGEYKQKKSLNLNLKIDEVIYENGLIYLKAKLDGESFHNKFRVVAIYNKSFAIYYDDGFTAFNYYVYFPS